ncbi:MAG TPA: MOSC domain-containing protein [Afifellaceae bacterium]|nr:MOSC domain-containing protein [Afifellaceae bacterium]
MNQSAIIKALYRYPLKGFSAEPLESAALKAGETLPFDRAFAIENGPSGFDPAAPSYLPKIRFLMLMRHERVARYTSRFDPQTGVLTLGRPDRNPGQAHVAASLDDEAGRSKIEDWIAAEFPDELRGPPRIVSAPGHSFSDKKQKVLHLINLASVRMLEEKVGRTIDPMRFRANIVIDGVPPFTEFDWIGKRLQLTDLTLAGEDRTERCAATNVEPETGIRDINLPRSLMGLFGHTDFGIYVKAQSSGTISIGDAIEPA